MRPGATLSVILAAALAACSGGGSSGAGGGGGGGGGPISCVLQSDCPLKYECASGTCLALGTSTTSLQVTSYTPNQPPRWVKDTFTVTFNEPVRLGANGVLLVDEANGYKPIAAHLALSADQTTVTITPLGVVAPANVWVTFGSGLTDNWGHTCGQSWGYDYPAWITGYPGSEALSTWLNGLTSAVDGAGAPYVAWVAGAGSCGGALHVHRSDSTTWTDDSGRLPLDPTTNAAGSSLAARGNTVAVSWVESGCVPTTVRVASRTGAGNWSLVGGPAHTGTAMVAFTSLALDASGHPVVAWQEGNKDVHAARFDGTSWSALGGPVGGVTNAARPSIALGPGDVPCVSFPEYTPASTWVVDAYCWDGGSSSWKPLAGGRPMATPSTDLATTSRALAFDSGGAPFVGWGRNGNVEAATFDGVSWTTLTVASAAVNLNPLAPPELAIDPASGIVAGWGGSRDVGAASYGSGAWHLMPTIVDVYSLAFVGGSATFAAGPSTGPWGAWILDGVDATYIRSVRSNR